MPTKQTQGSVIDQIKKRISVRTFKENTLSPEVKERIREAFSQNLGPFGGALRFELIERDAQKDFNAKLGTYGVIKGATSYVAAVINKGDKDLEDFGYVLEKIILHATSLGLGTCWLGGTFTKGEFSKAIRQKDHEILPCITPIGYPGEKRSLVESAMRFAAGSDNRKNWQEVFYHQVFGQALTESEAGEYASPLEMVRIAPSASNKQPWRIVKDQGQFHFYLQHTKGYGTGLGFDIQRVDMGIAMCHFELAATELGLTGKWQILNSNPSTTAIRLPQDTEYIVSWI